MFIIAKIFRHRQRGVPDQKAAAGRLIHLTENHHHVIEHAGFLDLPIKLLAFSTALANAAENTDALLMPDHVVNHFSKQHGLADAGTAEQSGLAASLERRKHIDHFDSSLKNLRRRRTLRQGGGS